MFISVGTLMQNKPNTIDIAVGSRICERRTALSMTESALAEKLGMSLEQIRRAEGGVDKVSASRLQRISEILDVPVMFFFRSASDDLVPLQQSWESLQSSHEDVTALAQAFSLFENKRKRSKIRTLVQSLSSKSNEADNEN